jgi:hypothetical protein
VGLVAVDCAEGGRGRGAGVSCCQSAGLGLAATAREWFGSVALICFRLAPLCPALPRFAAGVRGEQQRV